jgi:hypothetical protein
MLRSKVWRPRFWPTHPEPPGRLGYARAVARRGCLQWLDVDGLKGGASLLDQGEAVLARFEPGRAVPRRETPQVERRRARLPVTRQAGASKRCPDHDVAPPALRSLMGAKEEEKAAPRA